MGKQFEMYSNSSELDGFETKFYEKEGAKARFSELFGFDYIVLLNALMKGDSGLGLRSICYPARYLNRWSDIVGSSAEQLYPISDYKYKKHNGQPCIENNINKKRMIFMSGNDDIGNPLGVISAKNSKGIQSENHIKLNSSLYVDSDDYKTWIFYFPSASSKVYGDDESLIKFEVSYPLSFIKSNKGKQKIHPCHHEERLCFDVSNDDFLPKDTNKADIDDEDDFELGLKEA